jgi:hypothetical protein
MEPVPAEVRLEMLKLAVQLLPHTKATTSGVGPAFAEMVSALHHGYLALGGAEQPLALPDGGPAAQR